MRRLFGRRQPLDDFDVVCRQLEFTLENLRRAPAHDHALQKDLEIIQNRTNRLVQRDIQLNRGVLPVDAEDGTDRRIVDPVVDIEVFLDRVSDAVRWTSLLSARISAAETGWTAVPVFSS
jgi:hypothetical protein